MKQKTKDIIGALLLGLLGASLGLTPGLTLKLPVWAGSLGVLLAGVFVGMLASALENSQPIIIVTIQTFPFVLKAIENSVSLKQRKYAVIADEAH